MALTKDEHIAYWVKSALDSLETAEYLFHGKKYIEALFFTHLHLEKLSKALWVSDNETNYPPKIHNLVRLVEKSSANLTEEDVEFLDMMNVYQIEGRYPDYLNMLYKDTDKILAKEYLDKSRQIGKCLLEKLP